MFDQLYFLTCASLAQLDRAAVFYTVGQWFESTTGRQKQAPSGAFFSSKIQVGGTMNTYENLLAYLRNLTDQKEVMTPAQLEKIVGVSGVVAQIAG